MLRVVAMSFFLLVFPENSDMTSFSGLIIPRFKALCCHNFVLVKIVVTYASLFFGALQKINSMPLIFGLENVSDEPRCRCFLRCLQKTATFDSNVIRHRCLKECVPCTTVLNMTEHKQRIIRIHISYTYNRYQESQLPRGTRMKNGSSFLLVRVVRMVRVVRIARVV